MAQPYPYKNWTRNELYAHCLMQADEYGFDRVEMSNVIYDKRWVPQQDFNGCTLVQDPLHPFWPCLRHDWAWIVGEGGREVDDRFREDLIQSGMYGAKAKRWFIGVRIGWFFSFKWLKK